MIVHVLYLMLITDIFIVSHAYMYIVFPPNFFLYILHAHSHAGITRFILNEMNKNMLL